MASPKMFRPKVSSGGMFCCVPGCANKSSKDKIVGEKLSYYRFPLQDPKRTKLWVSQVRRASWFPKSYDRICSVHFEGGKKGKHPKDEGYVPTIFPARQKSIKKRTTLASERASTPMPPPSKRRIFEADITPVPAQALARPLVGDEPPNLAVTSPLHEASIADPDPIPMPADGPCENEDEIDHVDSAADTTQTVDAAIDHTKMDHDYQSTFRDPTYYSRDYIELQKEVQELRKENELLKQKTLSLDSIKDNDSDFRYMTGLVNYSQFKFLMLYLFERCDGNLKYWNGKETMKHDHFALSSNSRRKPGPDRKLSFEEEFFMVLVKLKCGLDNRDLHLRLRVSESTISKTFSTWINFLDNELTILFELPPVDLTNVRTMPCFNDFPDVQIVLDCTELFAERSSDLQARKETFSNYKNHDTVKFLVGVSPSQSVNYVSAAWGGRATDKHITLHSDDLLASLPEGSSVMADRGFLVTDELAALGVKLIMPHFKGRDRPQFSAQESSTSAKISSARVHIERSIQRIKTFHILERSIRMNQRDIVEQTFRTCAYLSNLQAPIVKL